MQKGVSVQGLTTAASLWAVACLGLAAGNGDYFIVFVGTISMMWMPSGSMRMPMWESTGQ